MTARIRSFSKINLGLAIGPAREDGFHSLATVYQTLALFDIVTVEAAISKATTITVSSSHPRVPGTGSNTAWKMIERALKEAGRTAAVKIHIEKRLPIEGGLGGGSANAVAALLGLEQELGIRFSEEACLRMCSEIGSDVPLFLIGGTVFGTGRGEIVTPLPDSASLACVLALPEVRVSTAQAFRDWDRSLTVPGGFSKIERLSDSVGRVFPSTDASGALQRKGLAESPLLELVRSGIENDFERVVFSQYPLLDKIKHALEGASGERSRKGSSDTEGAIYTALSGSGSTVFGLYRGAEAAEEGMRRLQALGIRAIATRTLPRREYRRKLSGRKRTEGGFRLDNRQAEAAGKRD